MKKPPKGPDGKIIKFEGIGADEAVDQGIIDTPKQYGEGAYNTDYVPFSATEKIIIEIKAKRYSPMHRELLEALVIQNHEDEKLTDEEIREYLQENILNKAPRNITDVTKYPYIDIRYFSEYIAQLGFSTSVEVIINPPAKSFFFVVISLVPPGRLYTEEKKELGLDQTHAGSDVQTMYQIDFDSPQKAMSFNDGPKKFYITKTEAASVMIYELFEVKPSKTKIDKVTSFGFSVVPLFQHVEVDGSFENFEVYLNT